MADKSNSDTLADNNIELIKIDAYSSLKDVALLRQYFAIRSEVFPPPMYMSGVATEHDLDPDNLEATKKRATEYILGMQNGKVLGGTTYHHTDASSLVTPLPPPRTGGLGGGKLIAIKDILPEKYLLEAGIKPENMKYLAPSGLAVSQQAQEQGIGTQLTKAIFNSIEDKADFFQIGLSSPNLSTSPKVLKQSGFDAIVLTDNMLVTGSAGILVMPILFTKKHPKVFENMIEKHGIGMSLEQFLGIVSALKKERKDLDFKNFAPEEQARIFEALQAKIAECKSAASVQNGKSSNVDAGKMKEGQDNVSRSHAARIKQRFIKEKDRPIHEAAVNSTDSPGRSR